MRHEANTMTAGQRYARPGNLISASSTCLVGTSEASEARIAPRSIIAEYLLRERIARRSGEVRQSIIAYDVV